MTALLTYLQFHALFVVPVLVLLGVTTPYRLASRRTVLTATALLAGLALVYTTPWDNYLIERGVWWYGEGTVLIRWPHAPLGEYLFFVFQPFLVGLWLARLQVDTTPSLRVPVGTRLVGLVAAALVGVAGLLLLERPGGLYLGSLLAWGAPILAIQWTFGWQFLVREWRTVAIGTLVPTLYLWLIDSVALALDIWSLSDRHTLGVAIPVLNLPIEEAVFFLITSLFVVQGIVLYVWVVDRWA